MNLQEFLQSQLELEFEQFLLDEGPVEEWKLLPQPATEEEFLENYDKEFFLQFLVDEGINL